MSQITDYRGGVRALSEAQWSKSLYHNQERSPLFDEVRALWVAREIAARENTGKLRAKTFKTKTENEGETITLIRLRQSGLDQENHPIYEETWTNVKGFCVKDAPSDRGLEVGALIKQPAKFQLPCDVDVDEIDFELLSGEQRWRVVGTIIHPDHLEIEAERKTS